MFSFLCTSILYLLVANGQPLPSCKVDAHCAVGYYCRLQANVCQKCLQCQDLNRDPPKLDVFDVCIKSIHECGPCSEGFVNMYKNVVKGTCVIPEFYEFGSGSHYAFVWITAAALGLLFVGIVTSFVYVIKHTDVFRVVTYYNAVSGSTPLTGTSVPAMSSPRHLLKYLLRFDKDTLQIIWSSLVMQEDEQ